MYPSRKNQNICSDDDDDSMNNSFNVILHDVTRTVDELTKPTLTRVVLILTMILILILSMNMEF